MDRSSKQNINNDIVSLNNTLDEMDLTDIYIQLFIPKKQKYTFFSSVHGTFSKIDHMIGHKASLNKFKKIEIISSILSDMSIATPDFYFLSVSLEHLFPALHFQCVKVFCPEMGLL